MKKLFLIFNVMLIFLITTIGRVKAYEKPVGYFFGKEYPIIYQDPNVTPLYDVDGFSVDAYYRDSNGSWVWYNQAFSGAPTGNIQCRFNINLPDILNKYENFDFSIVINTNTTIVNYQDIILTGSDSGGMSFSVSGMNLVFAKPGVEYRFSKSDLVCTNGPVDLLQFTYNLSISSSTTTYSSFISALTITGVSTDGLIASIANVLSELVPYIMNIDEHIASILTFMQPILNAINSGTTSIVSAINSMSGSVVSAINSMSNAIQSDLNTINSSINSMNTNLGTKIDSMKTTLNNAIVTMMITLNNSLNDLLGENEDTTKATNENDSTTSNFESVSGQYDDIEHSAVEDFENNLANVDTDTDLLNVADFKSTSNFIATNLTNIYNSHNYLGNMIIFSLVIGFSLTLIGIKVRR